MITHACTSMHTYTHTGLHTCKLSNVPVYLGELFVIYSTSESSLEPGSSADV
jgi:hypothetical protein